MAKNGKTTRLQQSDAIKLSLDSEVGPDHVTGKYTGARSIETRFGARQIHTFEGKDGPIELWGSTLLNRHLPKFVGKHITVTIVEEGGGGKAHTYDVTEV